jgi:tetratricopeptide (TPR) repeat protein
MRQEPGKRITQPGIQPRSTGPLGPSLLSLLLGLHAGVLPSQVPPTSETLRSQAQTAYDAKRWQDAVPLLRQLIGLKPELWEAHQLLGNACLNLGQYPEAIEAFDKGIALCQKELEAGGAGSPRLREALGRMLTAEGNAYLKAGKPQQAVSLYARAAEIDPNPGLAYFNLAVTLYNQGQMEAAARYSDKAIAADPTRVDVYFIKGSALFGTGTLDAAGRYMVPPGTREALERYLALAPGGAHAADVKAMLDMMIK